MLSIFIGFLTVVLFLDSAFLILLVLLQLPKKEAGAGVAFGGGATDVLFGAGTGNVLTKATAYASGLFLGLCLLLSILQNHNRPGGGALQDKLNQRDGATPVTAPASPASPSTDVITPVTIPATTTEPAASTPAPAAPATTPDNTDAKK